MQTFHAVYLYRAGGSMRCANATFATDGVRSRKVALRKAEQHFADLVATGAAEAGTFVPDIMRFDPRGI